MLTPRFASCFEQMHLASAAHAAPAAISTVLTPRFASCFEQMHLGSAAHAAPAPRVAPFSRQTHSAPATQAGPTAISFVKLVPYLSLASCRQTLHVEGKHHRGAASLSSTSVACGDAHTHMGGMNATIQKMPTRDAWSEEAELRVTGTAGALHSNELWASRKRRLSTGVAGVWSFTPLW